MRKENNKEIKDELLAILSDPAYEVLQCEVNTRYDRIEVTSFGGPREFIQGGPTVVELQVRVMQVGAPKQRGVGLAERLERAKRKFEL
jgi:hypothetical protein